MTKLKIPYWYITDGSLDFLGIVQSSKNPSDASCSAIGPYDTLAECKADAIARFRFDIEHCRAEIRRIKCAKIQRAPKYRHFNFELPGKGK